MDTIMANKLVVQIWGPAILAGGKAIAKRFYDESWDDIDEDTQDTCCFAAREAIFAFHNEASRMVDVEC